MAIDSRVHVLMERHVSVGHLLSHSSRTVIARTARLRGYASLGISLEVAEWSAHSLVTMIVALTLGRVRLVLLPGLLDAVREAHLRQSAELLDLSTARLVNIVSLLVHRHFRL